MCLQPVRLSASQGLVFALLGAMPGGHVGMAALLCLQPAPAFRHMSAAPSQRPSRPVRAGWVAAEPVCRLIVSSVFSDGVASDAAVVVVVVDYLVVVEFVVVVDCVVVVVRVFSVDARGVVEACTFVVRAPCVGVRPHTAPPPPRP